MICRLIPKVNYLQSQNRTDRLTSPYALTITRSLPSLIANDCDSENVINMIISVPSYIIRGAGTSSHYEFEVRVVANDDSWTLLRRYRRFRELYVSMRQKYGTKVSKKSCVIIRFVIFNEQIFMTLLPINKKDKN